MTRASLNHGSVEMPKRSKKELRDLAYERLDALKDLRYVIDVAEGHWWSDDKVAESLRRIKRYVKKF